MSVHYSHLAMLQRDALADDHVYEAVMLRQGISDGWMLMSAFRGHIALTGTCSLIGSGHFATSLGSQSEHK
jgi:hypothetical protein